MESLELNGCHKYESCSKSWMQGRHGGSTSRRSHTPFQFLAFGNLWNPFEHAVSLLVHLSTAFFKYLSTSLLTRIGSVNIFRRRSVEPAHKTLRRLSISLERRIRSEERKLGPNGQNQKNPDKLYYYQLGRRATREPHSDDFASVWIQNCGEVSSEAKKEEEAETDKDGYIRYHLPKEMSIARLWETLSAFPSCKLHIHLRDEYGSTTIILPVIACPPTITAVRTFENFSSRVFVGVPLVVEVQVQHACRAVVVWFVDQAVTRLDSPVYTPSSDDIGKTLSVLVFPIRQGQISICN